MKKTGNELSGAWEEPGVIGTRVEIEGGRITVLWRGGPVLVTKFKTVEKNGFTELVLEDKGLRYRGALTDYATVTSVTVRDDIIELEKSFPITGPSKEILKRTANNRYGNYDIEDGVLEELAGKWRNDDMDAEAVFSGGTMTFFGTKRKVHVLRPRRQSSGPYIIADEDPSVDDMGGFSRFEYLNGTLTTRMLICDGPTVTLVFKKIK